MPPTTPWVVDWAQSDETKRDEKKDERKSVVTVPQSAPLRIVPQHARSGMAHAPDAGPDSGLEYGFEPACFDDA